MPASAGRRFLLVSLPFGPFGRLFIAALRQRGADVRHMIFNAGDVISARGAGGVVHRGSVDAWRARLPELARDVTDIVIFGESGPYNRAVLDLDEAVRPRVWVLENGYFRPDWVTVERDGANAASRLPRTRGAYRAAPPVQPPPTPNGPALRSLVFHLSLYYLTEFVAWAAFPRYRTGFPTPPWLQCAGHIRRYFSAGAAAAEAEEARILARPEPRFLVCLQRDGDSQLRVHSPFRTNAAFMDEVLDSFARAAPADARLVVKNHPLDPGVDDLRRMTIDAARARGLVDRVDFIDGGRLAALCRASQGLVVNNSSAAFSALGFGTPVKALGRAIFDFDGLTDPQPLDGFWSAPRAPDPALFLRFRGHVMARTQVNGSFDARRTRAETADRIAAIVNGNPPPWRTGD